MSSIKTLGAAPRPYPARSTVPAWAVVGLVLLALATLIGFVAAPAPRVPAGLAAPEQQRVIEDWRGNSAGFERRAE